MVHIELREAAHFNLASLAAGGDGMALEIKWIALAPHLEHEVELTPAQCVALGAISSIRFVPLDALRDAHGEAVDALLASGLLLPHGCDAPHAGADARLRSMHWWPLAATFHRAARWRGVDGVQALVEKRLHTAQGLVHAFGSPPPAADDSHGAYKALPDVPPGPLDVLLASRVTCRNFDETKTLEVELLGRMLKRVFGAQSSRTVDGATFLKKLSPSAGGLHPTDAYVFVRNVDMLDPGIYHYHAVEHALAPFRVMPLEHLDTMLLDALAGQYWFRGAHVLVAMVPRFERTYWKYRNHSKAYRAVMLDVGHLSQTLYLSATELRLGAFVTAAINDAALEQALRLDGVSSSPLVLAGFGWRSARMTTAEFDPAGTVWPSEAADAGKVVG